MTTGTLSKLADELEALERNVAAPPWFRETKRIDGLTTIVDGRAHGLFSFHCEAHEAALIVAMRNNLPTLIASLRELEKVREAGLKILAKLDHPTASVTQWDADDLRAALTPPAEKGEATEGAFGITPRSQSLSAAKENETP